MRKHLLAAGIAAAALIPSLAMAQTSCEQQQTSRTTGTVVGAGAGAVLGAAVAGRDDRATGAVLGGIVGAIAGNQLSKPKTDCARAYGYYDDNGMWHANSITQAQAAGYYDRDGRWVDGQPNGYYDAQGRWVSANTQAAASGYWNNGRWVPASASGYYDVNGQWVAGSAPGYYDTRGRWVAGPTTGRYDANGRWLPGQAAGHRNAQGVWVADAQPGYYQNGRWVAGPAMGYYDARPLDPDLGFGLWPERLLRRPDGQLAQRAPTMWSAAASSSKPASVRAWRTARSAVARVSGSRTPWPPSVRTSAACACGAVAPIAAWKPTSRRSSTN